MPTVLRTLVGAAMLLTLMANPVFSAPDHPVQWVLRIVAVVGLVYLVGRRTRHSETSVLSGPSVLAEPAEPPELSAARGASQRDRAVAVLCLCGALGGIGLLMLGALGDAARSEVLMVSAASALYALLLGRSLLRTRGASDAPEQRELVTHR